MASTNTSRWRVRTAVLVDCDSFLPHKAIFKMSHESNKHLHFGAPLTRGVIPVTDRG